MKIFYQPAQKKIPKKHKVTNFTKQSLTSIPPRHLEHNVQLGDHVDGARRGGPLVHGPDEDGAAELPLLVRLRLDSLVGVGHHGDQQVDQHHQRDHQVDAEEQFEDHLAEGGHQVQWGHVVRLHQAEQREEEHLQRLPGRREAHQLGRVLVHRLVGGLKRAVKYRQMTIRQSRTINDNRQFHPKCVKEFSKTAKNSPIKIVKF